MIIAHEENASSMDAAEPFRRTLKVLLSPSLNPGLDSLAAGFTIIPPGGKSEEHKHMEGEMFFVCSGYGLIKVGNETERLKPCTAVWGPSDITHQMVNDSSETLKVLWVLCPPGREEDIIKNSKSR